MSHSENSNATPKHIDRLFLKFAAFYGHIWRGQFKNDEFITFAKREWGEGLVKFSDRILEQAILVCRDHKEFPPTLPQFIRLCRATKNQNDFMDSARDDKPANPAIAKKHLLEIKKSIGAMHAHPDTPNR